MNKIDQTGAVVLSITNPAVFVSTLNVCHLLVLCSLCAEIIQQLLAFVNWSN